MTPVLKVLTEYCSIYVDDINLSDLASDDPALYGRRMWEYLRVAIPLFQIPPEMQEYLLGTETNPKLTVPTYDSTTITLSGDSDSVDLGADYKGYDICSCRVRSVNRAGDVILTPIESSYDAETAIVTFSTTIAGGTVLDFDLYTDGKFIEDLTPSIMNILGICFQCVWQDRFNTDWLSIVSKVDDKSFSEQNRANKMRADTERLNQVRRKLAEEMRRFSQNLYYKQIVNNKIEI